MTGMFDDYGGVEKIGKKLTVRAKNEEHGVRDQQDVREEYDIYNQCR